MSEFLPFVVIGIATGAVYGLAGTGLVLTYKTSGIFNFAYGSIAALSVFVFYFLHDEHGMPWPWAAVLCVLVMGPVEGVLLELVARRLDPVSATLKVVATVGLLLVILGVGTLWFGNQTSTFPSFLPTSTVRVVGVNVTWEQIIVTIVSVVATAALYCLFRFVRLGVAMRAVVDNPELLDMTGESAVRVRRWAWIIGTVFASAAGLLLAPSLSLDALIITMLVVQAFGAAAVGYFSNLPLTFAGGLAIGIAGALASKYVVSISWLSGLPVGLPFIILFVVLVVTPRGRLMERRLVHQLPVRSSWYAPTRVRVGAATVVLVALAFVPQVAGAHLTVWSAFLIDVILFLSLGLMVRKAGQISLCHLAFAAVGAAAFGHLLTDWHVPWLAALVVSGLIAVPVGALVAIPAIRLSGVFLAIATFGFGVLLAEMVYPTNLMFGVNAGVPTPRPDVSIGPWHLSSDAGFYYLLLVFAVLAVVGVLAAERGRLGRLLGGLADSPPALEAHGTTTNTTLVLVFCIGAAMAAMAGALTSSLYSYAVGANFAPFTSLTLVALVVIVTIGDPWYALVAALGFAVFPGYVTAGNVNTYLEIVFGLFAALFALQNGKAPSVPAAVRRRLEVLGAHRRGPMHAWSTPQRAGGVPAGGSPTMPSVRVRPAGLEVEGLSVRFGGVQAVDGVSLRAVPATITGLIGPNGAGKTTIFNVCSGLVRPSAGTVVLHGADVTRMAPAERARRGLGRTFQRVQLFDSLTVRRNVELGREASMAGGNPFTQLVSRPQQRAEVRERSEEALALVGIEELAGHQAGLLSTGQRRLVELARVLAGRFDVLLLDEPSSGLGAAESRHFGDTVAEVVRRRGVTVVLIEHDMTLVRQVCSVVFVIDFGRLIFEGTTEQMLASDEVRNAYLGSGDATAGMRAVPT
jgi:ABC-type branched-subunit amino acid transport system ATPase component/branched-subunit amino acid ABC-type transport system permease component